MSGAGHVTVRQAHAGDLDAIVRFNAAMALETEGKSLDVDTLQAGVLKLLSDDSLGFYLLAESGGRAAGQLMITDEWSDWRNAPLLVDSKRVRRPGFPAPGRVPLPGRASQGTGPGARERLRHPLVRLPGQPGGAADVSQPWYAARQV